MSSIEVSWIDDGRKVIALYYPEAGVIQIVSIESSDE